MTSYDGGVYLEEVTATPLAVYTLLSLPQMRRQVAWAHVLLFSQRAGRAIISEWKILYHSGSVSPLFCRGWWHLHRKWLLIWKADLHRERERQRCCLIWLVKLECFESFAAIKLFGSEMCNHFSEQNSTACLFVFFIYIESFCTLHNNFKLSYESRLSCSKLLFPQRLFGGKMSYVFVLGRFHTCLIWAVIACHRNILYGIRYAVTNMQSLCLFLFPLGVSPKHADCSPT